MKYWKPLILLFIPLFTSLLFGCKTDLNTTKEIPSPTANTTIPSKKGKQIKSKYKVTVYDFDVSKKEFAYKELTSYQNSGDQLRDAIYTFITQSHLKGDYSKIRLAKIRMQNGQSIFSFKGPVNFKTTTDKSNFKMALDRTIAYNYSNQNYSITLNGNNF